MLPRPKQNNKLTMRIETNLNIRDVRIITIISYQVSKDIKITRSSNNNKILYFF